MAEITVRKKMEILETERGADLLIERDAGNEIRILMGRGPMCLETWKDLRDLCDEAVKKVEALKP